MGSLEVLDSGVVAQRLASLRLAPRRADKVLCLWPLLPCQLEPPCAAPTFRLLSEALEDGMVGLRVRPRRRDVLVENRAPQRLLVLAGEPLGSPSAGLAASESRLAAPRESLALPAHRRPALASRPPRALCELAPLEGQLGFVSSLGDRVLGIELFGSPQGFSRALPILVAVHWARAVEASFQAGPSRGPRFDAPEPFLEALRRTPARLDAEPVEGRLRLEGHEALGRALLREGGLVHLSARPKPASHSAARSG